MLHVGMRWLQLRLMKAFIVIIDTRIDLYFVKSRANVLEIHYTLYLLVAGSCNSAFLLPIFDSGLFLSGLLDDSSGICYI